MLAKDGHRCLRARNGQEALRLFWDERPDLIILDVMMPLLDGFQVCERIREHDRATPVLFLTAKGRYRGQAHWLRHWRRRLFGKALQRRRAAVAGGGSPCVARKLRQKPQRPRPKASYTT